MLGPSPAMRWHGYRVIIHPSTSDDILLPLTFQRQTLNLSSLFVVWENELAKLDRPV